MAGPLRVTAVRRTICTSLDRHQFSNSAIIRSRLFSAIFRPNVNSPDEGGVTKLHSIVAVHSGHSRQFAAGFSQNDAILGLADRVFDPIDPDRFRMPQVLPIVRSKCLGVLAQRFQPQRPEGS